MYIVEKKEELYKNRDWLYQKVVVEKLRDIDIARMFNIDRKTASYWRLKKFKIDIPLELYENKKWLEEKLLKEKKDLKQVSLEAGTTIQTVRKWARKLQIDFEEERRYLIDTHPNLVREWNEEKNKEIGLEPNRVTFGSDKIAWWTCSKNSLHVWDASIGNRARLGVGCPYCNKKRVLPEESLEALRPDIAMQWNYEKNKKKPSEFSISSAKRAWWKCSHCIYEWSSVISSRTRSDNNKCPACVGKAVTEWNCLLSIRPDIASEWCSEKNGSISPRDVTSMSGKRVWWKCSECHHSWDEVIAKRVGRGDGCTKCSGKVISDRNSLSVIRPDLSLQWDYERNKGSPYNTHVGSNRKVWWVCNKDDCNYRWKTTPNHRNKNPWSSCPSCNNRVLNDRTRLSTGNPSLAEEWHPTRNNLDVHEVSLGQHYMAWWLGKCGHEWQAMVYSRNSGTGCGVCNKASRTSFPEQAIYFYIEKIFEHVESGEKLRVDIETRMEADIFIPRLRLVIEYDGVYFHQDTERDILKNKIVKESNMNIIRIREVGLTPIEDCHIIEAELNNKNLNEVIRDVMNYISVYYLEELTSSELEVLGSIDVNYQRDESEIREQYEYRLLENSFASVNPDIVREWSSRNNIKPESVSPHSHARIWWVCDRGHEWETTPSARTSGTGCPYCSGNKLSVDNSLGYLFPESLEEWHPTKNGDLTPYDVTKSSSKKFWFLIKSDRNKSEDLIETYTSPSGRLHTYKRRRKLQNEMEID